MKAACSHLFLALVLLTGAGPAAAAVDPHLGLVFPAGGVPGATLTVTLAGQHLQDVTGWVLDTHYEAATPLSYERIYERQEANRVRRLTETLEARLAEAKDADTRQQLERARERLQAEQAMIMAQRQQARADPMAAARRQFNPQIAERITLTLTIPATATAGDAELRVLTRHGLSNPIRFQVGQLPEVTENEPNDGLAAAQLLAELPVLVNGQVMPGDQDRFRVSARRGQTLVFRLEARALVPYLADAVPGWMQGVLTLHDVAGREVAHCDDVGSDPDPVLIYEVPDDGELTVTVRDAIYRGREDFVFRLSIGELPYIERITPLGGPAEQAIEVTLHGVNLPGRQRQVTIPAEEAGLARMSLRSSGWFSNALLFQRSKLPEHGEAEPNDDREQAQPLTEASIVNGSLDRPGDHDWYRIEGRRDQPVYLDVYARRLGSPVDSRLSVWAEDGQRLASNDDAPDRRFGLLAHQADARLEFVPPGDGRYWVLLEEVAAKGGPEFDYRLEVSSAHPDFELRVTPASLRLPQDGAAVAEVEVIRLGGYDGPVALHLVGAPPGVSLVPVTIPAGAMTAPVTLRASRQAVPSLVGLRLEGTARVGGQEIRRRAVPARTMMQAFSTEHLVPARLLLARLVEPDPVTVTLTRPRGETVLRVRPGETITLPARAEPNQARGRQPVRLSLDDPPEWLTLGTESIPRQGGSRIVLHVSANATPGPAVTVVLNGEARVARLPSDPDFDPVNRARNVTPTSFPIAALAIQVID